jgi:hypothetical protein
MKKGQFLNLFLSMKIKLQYLFDFIPWSLAFSSTASAQKGDDLFSTTEIQQFLPDYIFNKLKLGFDF